MENEYERHKARLVVKGYIQQKRIQILDFGSDIGLCVSAVAGGRNGVHGANSRFSSS
jgi:hypothetical protein